VPFAVRALGRHDLEILWAVVVLLAVPVVDLLARLKPPADGRLGYKPVLIDVAARVGEVMTREPDEHVARRGRHAATLPVRRLRPG
jgi:hypothetical protein